MGEEREVFGVMEFKSFDFDPRVESDVWINFNMPEIFA